VRLRKNTALRTAHATGTLHASSVRVFNFSFVVKRRTLSVRRGGSASPEDDD
jgi:hypothetical protein